jgi:2,4-dienoyl-CoA reductase-like NADH-dependent reductase (Old Yellow Enzyme family)/thioredoxin reductase
MQARNPNYPHLFEPGKIGHLDIRNRIVKAPTSTGMSNADGTVNDRLIRHYQSQASGGGGLLIVEYAYIDDIASKSAHCQLGISTLDHISGLAWLADVIKEKGARAAIQIEHCGRQKFLGTLPIKAASPVSWPALEQRRGASAIPEELTEPEIEQIIEAFGDAAERAVLAGFELIELHGAHGYLITNFLSPHTNKRTDGWGGSLQNRMRLLVEVIKNTRSKIGGDFPLTVRLSGTDYEPDGFGIEETCQVAKEVERLGLDAIHVSGGDHHQMIHQVSPMAIPRCHNVWAAEAIKKVVNIPVIASGSLVMPDIAEQVLAEEKGDFISLGRPLWADPEWPVKAEQGRTEDIRPCIRCNDGCLERTFFRFQAVSCTVNPTIGREGQLDIEPTTKRKKVAVIGAGPGGMEAARVAALRGHDVTMYEMRELGGTLIESSVQDFKDDIRFLIDNMVAEIGKSSVKVVMEKASAEMLIETGYDVAIVATGGSPQPLDIPGFDNELVCMAVDVLNEVTTPGKRVVILGGGETGVELSIYLAEAGHDVSLVQRHDELMIKFCPITDKIAYMERLAETRTKVMTGFEVCAIHGNGVNVRSIHSEEEQFLEADSVIISAGYASRNDKIGETLREKSDMEVFEVGDVVKTERIFEAIHGGYKAALWI